jgi:hypothetical protein
MIAEQIGRPNMPSSHCRYIQKAVTVLLLPAFHFSGRKHRVLIKQRSTSNPPFFKSTTGHATKNSINVIITSVPKPWFPVRKN